MYTSQLISFHQKTKGFYFKILCIAIIELKLVKFCSCGSGSGEFWECSWPLCCLQISHNICPSM